MDRFGVLTAGGDCPGTNAALRGLVARVTANGDEIIGVEKGWKGLMEGLARPLTRDDVRGVLGRGGTILGTSRLDPYVHGAGYGSVRPALEKLGLARLIVIGGDGSLRTALRLAEEGVAVVGIPKTIDNDIPGTDLTFGFHTAVQVVTDAIDRLTTTAESHDRIMVVEVMGRTVGWIATYGGLAGGAEWILVPEIPYDLAAIAARISRRHLRGHCYSLVVVAEGITAPAGGLTHQGVDAYGFERLGGVGAQIAAELERITGYEARVVTLGHLQRGGTPTAFDRVLASRMGIFAGELALEGRSGVMVAVRGDELRAVPLSVVAADPRQLPSDRYDDAACFFA